VLQHALAEGLPPDAVEAQALGAVRHLVESLRCLPSPQRLEGTRYEGLFAALVPVTITKTIHLLVHVLSQGFLARGQVPQALHVLEEALQLAPLIADRERRPEAALLDCIAPEEMKSIVRGLAEAEARLLQVCDEHLDGGWAMHAAELKAERDMEPNSWLKNTMQAATFAS